MGQDTPHKLEPKERQSNYINIRQIYFKVTLYYYKVVNLSKYIIVHNVYALSRILKYMKYKLIELNGEINKATI